MPLRFLREALRPLRPFLFLRVRLRPPDWGALAGTGAGGAADAATIILAAGAAGRTFAAGAFFLPNSQLNKPIYLRLRFTRRLLRLRFLRFLRVCL